MKDMWKSAIMGVVVGDALGTPVQFETREQVKKNPVNGMIGYRTFNMPVGTWTDDTSLTLALLDSIQRKGAIDLVDIMDNFVMWLENGMFTPYGFAFDIGHGTMNAIRKYEASHNVHTCGGAEATNNGNGSIMRIMPAVLYCIDRGVDDNIALDTIHLVSGLTHAHSRAKIACGLYYFMAKNIIKGSGDLIERLQTGIEEGFAAYSPFPHDAAELEYFARLKDLFAFRKVSDVYIRTTGYVVDTLEAAVWGLITTDSFKDALLKIVNLGGDTDSIAAVAGGLAGLYYGYDAIPAEWLDVIRRIDWIEGMIQKVEGVI